MKPFVWLVIFLLFKDVLCIPLANFYPFGEGETDSVVPRSDDGSSMLITLRSNFPFFDKNFRKIYVNSNGVISLGNSVSLCTSGTFPLANFQELIAPYWADVDTRGTGIIWYRETTDPDLLERADNEIRQAFPTMRFESQLLFISTWDHVGYFDQKTDRTNTFQAVLVTDGLQSFVIFLYADGEIQWTTGDASGGSFGLGGIQAQVGFDAGDGIRYAAIPQSQTSEIINIASTSNIGINGLWVFRTDEESVEIAGCEDLHRPGQNSTNDAPIRLTGGTNELEGRVEIMFEGIWGTICDSGWDDIDATIVCRELGYVNGAATRQAQFGTGSGILWLNHVGCLGTENKLSHCMHNGVGNIGSCSHAQDAGVICNTAIGCKVRLANGPTRYEGRVEVYYNDQWGTVCDDFWSLSDVQVVCSELGFGEAVNAPRRASYGQGSGPIWLDNLLCVGNESTIRDCLHNGWGIHNCAHFEDAGANCSRITIQRNMEPTTISITLFPRYGSVLGGSLIQVFGPCFDSLINSSITCHFDEIETRGFYADEDYIVCVSPSLEIVGRVGFKITVAEFQIESEEVAFHSLGIEDADMVSSENQLYVSEESVTIMWNSDMLLPADLVEDIEVLVDIDLILIGTESGDVDALFNLAESVPNDGIHSVVIPEYDDMSTVLVQVSVAEMVAPATISDYVGELSNEIKGKVKQFSEVSIISGSNFLRESCLEWSEEQPEGIGDTLLARLAPCPPTVARARVDRNFVEDSTPIVGDILRKLFHPGTANCFRQSFLRRVNKGSGQQCCYNDEGQLLVGPPGGGTVDLYAPIGIVRTLKHFYHDVRPFFYCCTGEFSDCREYYKHRPSDDGSRYILRPPGFIFGDPHMITLDGFKYTFNGKGEFTLVEHEDELFTLQARMEEALNSDGNVVQATVFTAIAAKQNDSDTVQFELSRRGLDALVNGERVIFDDLQKQEFTNVTVTNLGNQTLSALFSSGAYVQAKEENEIISVLLVSLSDSYRGNTSGLLGVFNGDMTDDLMMRNSSEYLPLNSTNEQIHQFGLDWIIPHENQSLFTYHRGHSWSGFHDPSFTPLFNPVFDDPELESNATFSCKNDAFCLYDVATTGRMDIGLSTLDGSMEFDEIIRLSYPVVCNPPCANGGACVVNDTCSCPLGYEGDRCSELVYSECDVNRCKNGGRCIKQGVSYICNCPSSHTGSLCETGLHAGGDADNDHMTLIIAIAAGVGGVLVVAVVIGLLCITVICCCRKGSKTEEKSCMSNGMHVTNPGYEVSPPEALNQEHPFASSSPALVYQNNSYQPNRQMGMHTNVANQQYQQMDQTPAGNTYEVNDQKEQLVPKSYI